MNKVTGLTKKDVFEKACFDIEHALNMYAFSFCTIPAEGIYDKQALASLGSVLEKCHIYLIGYTPRIDFVGAEQKDQHLLLSFEILSQKYVLDYELPKGLSLKADGDLWYLDDGSGGRFWPSKSEMQTKLTASTDVINFEVKYVGQAYGKDGSRSAIDRLIKHETLQKISRLSTHFASFGNRATPQANNFDESICQEHKGRRNED